MKRIRSLVGTNGALKFSLRKGKSSPMLRTVLLLQMLGVVKARLYVTWHAEFMKFI